VVAFEKSRLARGEIFKLEDALGPRGADIVGQISGVGEIVFHAVGDSGASNSRKYGNEINVADQLTTDATRPIPPIVLHFFFISGDVVYDFGESKFYYDQFYDPFRNYPAPIFAIPGNHDWFIVPDSCRLRAPDNFLPQFLLQKPGDNARGCFAPSDRDDSAGCLLYARRTFRARDCLVQQLARRSGSDLERTGQVGDGARLSAGVSSRPTEAHRRGEVPGCGRAGVSHPAFSYAPQDPSGARGNHGCSSAMLRQIDGICLDAGVYPHAFLSGHAHN
jgi:hypothetical protein